MNINLIKKELEGVIKKDYIETWLNTPNNAFDGKTPIQVILEGNEDKIQEMIYYIRTGQPM
jgi:hypothetical protein